MDGLSAPEVSERLDVNTGLLYKLRRQHLAKLDAASPPQAKEKRINEILKKRLATSPRTSELFQVHAAIPIQV